MVVAARPMTEKEDTKTFFSRGIEETMDPLYGTALRLTRTGADAEDLVAETVYRREAVRPRESAYEENDDGGLVALLNTQPDEFLIWWANPERQYFNNMLGSAIMAAIDDLPDAFRTTIILINVEGLTYDEAAEALGVPPGTVRSRMKRGRTLLQKALWQQARDAGFAGPTENSRHKA
jgi:RNA polymerase sigma-70 factor (ECF subfamily)